jgi:dTDP-4-amino-4,6-dideoxygalactose transaminase
MSDFIPVCQPTISREDSEAVARVVTSRWLGTGPEVQAFEDELGEYLGQPVVAVASCTAALFLCLRALGIGPGDRVAVPALTFAATANVVVHARAEVCFADVDPKTWRLSAEALEFRRRDITATIPVDIYGQPCSGDELVNLPGRVIRDAAHLIGADYRQNGEAAACFSFYPTKNITTIEGGAVATSDPKIADYVRTMSQHGLTADAWKRYGPDAGLSYDVLEAGYKANMTDVQAALGRSQLRRLPEFRERREALAQRYDAALPGLERPARSPRGIAHLYPVVVPYGRDRNAVRERMRQDGVGTGVHFESLTAMRRYSTALGTCPVAEYIGARTLSLPLYPHLMEQQQDRVVESFKRAVSW